MNIWKQFEQLLPKQQIIIGKIISVNEIDKTSVIQLLSGETISVKGSGEIGTNYLIKDGTISNEMPDISSYDVTIY